MDNKANIQSPTLGQAVSVSEQSALLHNLKRLAVLRLITCSGIAFSLWMLGQAFGSELQLLAPQRPSEQIISAWGILLLLTLLSLLNLWRARSGRAQAQGLYSQEMFAYLLLDSLLIVSLIYFTGGANNPFITYLLVPIVISASTLSWLSTWVLCVLAMSAYGLLLFIYQPLAALDVVMAQLGLSMHIVGMWLTFVLSALFIAYFVVNMAWDLRYTARQAAFFREQSIQNEHVMLLASQAASTAHEIGSPLTTLKVLSHELSLEKNLSTDAQDDLVLMKQQIELCQEKLQQLTNETQLEMSPAQPLTHFIRNALEQWLLLSPSGEYQWQNKEALNQTAPEVRYPQVLMQAIINLLDNAAKHSGAPIQLDLSWDNASWTLTIEDSGPGLHENFQLPNSPVDSQNGLGIGLLLSHSSIQRLGGQVTLENRTTEHLQTNHPESNKDSIATSGCLTNITVPFS